VKGFLDVVRESASKSTWSRGVELTRADAVHGLSEDEDGSVLLQVQEQQGMISHTATLHVADEDWQCTCSGPDDPCRHVAAATIALHQARKQGEALPAPKTQSGTLRYRLSRSRPSLAIERDIVHAGGVYRLESTLTALSSGRVDGPAFVATQADLAAERALGTRRRGPLPRGLLEPLFKALAACPHVTLDGEAVVVSTEPVLPYCRVVDAPGGFRLVLARDPEIDEALGDGVTLSGQTLRLAAEGRLNGRELQDLVRAVSIPTPRSRNSSPTCSPGCASASRSASKQRSSPRRARASGPGSPCSSSDARMR